MSSQNSGTINIKDLPGIISETKLWFVFPTIHGNSETGKKTFWTIMAGIHNIKKDANITITAEHLDSPGQDLGENMIGIIRTESGYVGSAPKSAKDIRILSGKNLGKANATNVFSQALREAYGKYRVQLEKTQETEYVRPMLATDYKSLKKLPGWPMYLQCKFDGNRVMTHIEPDNTILFYSRQLKPFLATSQGIDSEIVRLYSAAGKYFLNIGLPKSTRKSLFFDGEMYNHGVGLQEHGILRRKKKQTDAELEGFKYYMYDLCLTSNPDMAYSLRLKMLQDIFAIFKQDNPLSSYLVIVETTTVTDIETAEAMRDTFISSGFEGAILRVPDAPYKQSHLGYHSKVLLKLKPRYDAEYRIVGIAGGESKGKEEDALMIICETEDGEQFTVQPAMPLADRIVLFRKYTADIKLLKKELLGRLVKIYYDDLSNSGKPLRAKTKLEFRTDV